MSRRGDEKTICEAKLQSWKLIAEFRKKLAAFVGKSPPSEKGGPPRLLTEEDYLCSFLFAQFNPVIDSVRGLCACSDLARVQEDVCSRHLSLGSFSEAQSIFGADSLRELFQSLVREDPGAITGGGAPGSVEARRCAIDSTVIRAIPRMHWAEWKKTKGKKNHAVRLHLSFNLIDKLPADLEVGSARNCERAALKKMAKPGEFYVGDRYYGYGYQLLAALEEQGCGYVMRIRESASQSVLEELAISDEDEAAGVVSDCLVRLGARGCWHHGPVRVIRIEKPELDEPVLIVTNQLDPADYSAELLASIYRDRWKIELFFRWFKCVFGRAGTAHWFAESEEGVAIQIYSALIAALLLAMHTGRLPNKRTMEMLRFHSMGMVSEEEIGWVLARVAKRKAC